MQDMCGTCILFLRITTCRKVTLCAVNRIQYFHSVPHSQGPMLLYTNTWIEQNAQPHRCSQYLPFRHVLAVCSVELSMNTMTSLIYNVINYYSLQSNVPSQVGWSLLQDDALARLFNDVTERIVKWVLRMCAIQQKHCSCNFSIKTIHCMTRTCNLNCYKKLW